MKWIWLKPFFLSNTSGNQIDPNASLDYIREFRSKKCVRYEMEPKNNNTKELCYCGLQESQHEDVKSTVIPIDKGFTDMEFELSSPLRRNGDSSVSSALGWDPELCLKGCPTDAYGVLHLKNDTLGSYRPSDYVRLHDHTPMDKVLKLFTTHWTLMMPEPPKLAISVIGSCQSFGTDGTKKETFVSGLLNAVKSTNAWLLTDGLNRGIARVVGHAVNRAQSIIKVGNRMVSQIKCLGVTPYGLVKDNTYLVNDDLGKFNSVLYQVVEDSNDDIHISLNGDHTHFLLVDNGYRNEKATADYFWNYLVETVQSKKEDNGLNIPVVVLLVGGSLSDLQRCEIALITGIPVVVVKGTGKVADILADAVSTHGSSITRGTPIDSLLASVQGQDILSKLPEYIQDLDKNQLGDYAEVILKCCQLGSRVIVFDIDTDSSMDCFILDALLTGNAAMIGQLELALQWDRADIAETKIFPSFDWTMEDLNYIMKKALLDQKIDFFKLLVEKGIIMKNFLTVKTLTELYSSKPIAHLRKLVKWEGTVNLLDIHHLLEKLGLDHSNQCYERSSHTEWTFEDPYQELLLWAVITRRDELAVYLWEQCNFPLSAAVVTTCICNGFKDKLPIKDTEIKNEYRKLKNLFEKRAIQLLNEYYIDDQKSALSLVETSIPMWGELHALDLAIIAKDLAFVSTECCQAVVEQRWRHISRRFWFRSAYRGLLLSLHLTVILFNLSYALSLLEVLLIAVVFLDGLEKVFEVLSKRISKMQATWWFNYDITTLMLFIFAVIMRLIPDTFVIGKFFYALCGILFTCRLLRVVYFSANLGPKILIFIYMMPKLGVFVLFLLVVILGYSIASKALMNHPCDNRISLTKDPGEFITSLFFLPYWQMYGELLLGNFESDKWTRCDSKTESSSWWTPCEMCNVTVETSECVCSDSSQFVIPVKFLLAVYLFFGNVLLLNLIIAIFTNVFETIQRKSIEHWNFEMYRLIQEYKCKPVLPPPIAPFIYLWRWAQKAEHTKGKRKKELGNSYSETNAMLSLFERQVRSYGSRNRSSSQDDTIDALNKINTMISEWSAWFEEQNSAISQEKNDGHVNKSGQITEMVSKTHENLSSLSKRLDLLQVNLRDCLGKQSDVMEQVTKKQEIMMERLMNLEYITKEMKAMEDRILETVKNMLTTHRDT